jgi:hypothetical protein
MGYETGPNGEWRNLSGSLSVFIDRSVKRAYEETAVRRGLFGRKELVHFEGYVASVAIMLAEAYKDMLEDAGDAAALTQLDSLMKSTDDGSVNFHPLAVLDFLAETLGRLLEMQELLEDPEIRAIILDRIGRTTWESA